MNKFYEIAEKALNNSPVMTGREKIKTEEVISKYPQGITIDGFDVLYNGKDGYAVFTFREDPSRFLNGGALLTKMAMEWANAYAGDIQTASAELSASGGIKVQLSYQRTKRGNTITAVKILR